LAISIPRPADAAADVSTRRVPTTRGRILAATATAFVLAAALFALSRSPVFAVRHVDVRGAHHRSVAQILARAGVPAGANLLWLDTAAIARRLEADPWVARASVRRSLPRSLSVEVTERSPIAVLEGPGPTLLAADGTGLGPAPADERLPIVTLPPAAPATVGVPGEGAGVRALAALAGGVRHRVREVHVAVGGTVTLVLRGGSTVELGRPVDLVEKARALRRLLAWEHTRGTRLGRISLVAPAAPAATIVG
jgi:cell division protein FtsQ